MVRALLAALVISASAIAAPVPKDAVERERLAALWGKTEGKGEFTFADGRLTIRTGGEPVYDSRLPKLRTLPRTVRTVTGDFEFSVRVAEAATPDPTAKVDPNTNNSYFTHAGMFVEGGDYRVNILLRQVFDTRAGVVDKQPTRRVWVDAWFTTGGIVCLLDPIEEGKPPEFKFARKGDKVSVQYRFGEGKWSEPHTPRVKLDFPDEVRVGVCFTQTTFERLHATFDKFIIEKPAAKK